jgi:DNA end-binding protein Ku
VLSQTESLAIAKISMHRREHVVLIRPAESGLVLHTMYYEDELHRAKAPKVPQKAKFSSKELDLAKNLVEHLTAAFHPNQFHDTYRENLERLIEAKQKGKKIPAVKQPRKAPVVDLMEALQRSLKSSGTTRKRPASARPKRKAA